MSASPKEKKSTKPCPVCGSKEYYYEDWYSIVTGESGTEYHCKACGHQEE
jgi:DNA-directed RNA polymerase subunit M/transcription elongation factor TFIIS